MLYKLLNIFDRIFLNKPELYLTEVIVQISGKAYLRWTERKTKRNQRRGRSTTQTKVYSNQENYFKSPVTLLQST